MICRLVTVLGYCQLALNSISLIYPPILMAVMYNNTCM